MFCTSVQCTLVAHLLPLLTVPVFISHCSTPQLQTPAENDVRIMMWKLRLMCFPAVLTRLRVVFPSFSSSSSEGSPMSRHRQQGRRKSEGAAEKLNENSRNFNNKKIKEFSLSFLPHFFLPFSSHSEWNASSSSNSNQPTEA